MISLYRLIEGDSFAGYDCHLNYVDGTDIVVRVSYHNYVNGIPISFIAPNGVQTTLTVYTGGVLAHHNNSPVYWVQRTETLICWNSVRVDLDKPLVQKKKIIRNLPEWF